MDFRGQASPAPPGFLVISPFFIPAGVLVDLSRGAVKHQRRLVQQILLNQGCEDIFSYFGFVHVRNRLYTP